ncbi:hypothetical protein DVH05_015194 [Phytophthora capsici]|nr:hypothetical protein DVH05_015194 [Phytophthora capsici]
MQEKKSNRLIAYRYNCTRWRNEHTLNVLDPSTESEHDEESHSSFASEYDASNQNLSGSEAEGLDGGDIAPHHDLVGVPELDNTAFDSWDALEPYLKAYSKKTFQIYTIRTNTPVRTNYSRMQRNMSPAKPIPEEFKFYNKAKVCTHSGSPRRSVGQGMRPHQHSRSIGCKAQINACVHFGADWEIVITKQNA